MMPHGWKTGWRAWIPAVLWSAVIFVLSSIPGSAFPRLPSWWNADKFVHTGIYAVLGRALLVRRARHAAARPGCRSRR